MFRLSKIKVAEKTPHKKREEADQDENNIFKSKVKVGSDRSVVFACIAVGSRADAFTVVFGTDDQPWRGGRRKPYCLDVCRDHGGSNIVFLRDQFSLLRLHLIFLQILRHSLELRSF